MPLVLTLLIPLLAAAGLAVASGRLEGSLLVAGRSGAFLLGVMLLGVGVSCLVATNPGVALGTLIEFCGYVSIYVLIVLTIRSPLSLRRVSVWLFVGILLLAIQGLYQYLVVQATWRVSPGDVNPATNAGAYMFCVALLIGFGRLLRGADGRRGPLLWWAAGVIVIAIGLGFSFSRGAWLATSLGGGVLLLRARRWQPLALAVALFGALFLLPAVRERAQSAGSVDKADVTMADLRDGTRVVQLRNTVPLR